MEDKINIFVLDMHPVKAAEYHCDKHLIKMITETCQLLSTYYRSKGHDDPILYKPTHVNHPCNVWLRESPANVAWAISLLAGLIIQYTARYQKFDKFERAKQIHEFAFYKSCATYDPNDKMTPFKLCMPDHCKVDGDPVTSYRNYYLTEKRDFCTWKNGEPDWWQIHTA